MIAIATILLAGILGWQLLLHDGGNPPQQDIPTREDKIKQVYGTANPYVTPEKVRDTLASYGLEPQLSKFFDSDNFSPNKKMAPEASQTSRIPSSRGRNYGETRGWL